MISAVKNVLRNVLVGIGIAEEKIARNARDEQTLITRRAAPPIASLVTDPGRFETPDHREVKLSVDGKTIYKQIRTKRVMPVVMKITGENEEQAGGLVSCFIGKLPFFWGYEGIQGTVEPVREEYSDHDNKMNSRYEAAVVVEFAVDVGPMGTKAHRIGGIDEGESRYEEQQ